MSSPISGVPIAPLPVFNFSGRGDNDMAGPSVPDRRFAPPPLSLDAPSTRSVRLDISALGSGGSVHPLLAAVSRSSVTSLILADAAAEHSGESSLASTPRAPLPQHEAALTAARIRTVLALTLGVQKLELDLSRTHPAVLEALPELLRAAGGGRGLRELRLSAAEVTPAGGVALGSIIADGGLGMTCFALATEAPVEAAALVGLCLGLGQLTCRLESLRIDNVAAVQAPAASALLREAILTRRHAGGEGGAACVAILNGDIHEL